MLHLGISILPWGWKIKFHGYRPSQNSIWTNLDPKALIFDFFAIVGPIFSRFLSHWLEMWLKCGSLPMPFHCPCPCPIFSCQGRPLGPKKMGQNGSRTKWIQDKRDPGQDGSRTKWNQDKRDPGQYGSRTIGIHRDNREP